VALYQDLPVFRDVYRLTLRVNVLTQGFTREFKYTLGQDMKRDCLGLLRSIYRVNRSRDKAPLLDAFLDDFELLKLEVRAHKRRRFKDCVASQHRGIFGTI
jgi:hypothetical protein